MPAALFGLITALGWGGADFIARFTGRALGHHAALLGMLSVGALLLPVILWARGETLAWPAEHAWLLLVVGIGIMLATLLLYWGLARGPIALVAPLAGSYPALNVALEVALGARPTGAQWSGILLVMLGVVIVSRAAGHHEARGTHSRAELRATLAIAAGAALCFAFGVAAAQHAAQIYGELQTTVMGRWISLAALVLLVLARRRPVILPLRWWPLLVLQGSLDGLAYISLVSAGTGAGGAITAVVGSCFSAVTVLLAWAFLREAISRGQWLGIAAIVGGIALLTGG